MGNDGLHTLSSLLSTPSRLFKRTQSKVSDSNHPTWPNTVLGQWCYEGEGRRTGVTPYIPRLIAPSTHHDIIIPYTSLIILHQPNVTPSCHVERSIPSIDCLRHVARVDCGGEGSDTPLERLPRPAATRSSSASDPLRGARCRITGPSPRTHSALCYYTGMRLA